ncbi:alpha-hydroxy-acid oxidizing protein [Sporomusa acidovorans]|uniref:L-lactate oxidase n=1 Tax=Sporomusa acidovorans (strain ATCC 49682 / DSM 3132 / Mol) TaxID=1123286 RepID=A0ABZ3J6Q1_SPOA4|nr:alpha-hydroxy-acid oxidizing protein [Sporomusa acidovorans]OZC24079.1 L-lactate dehydrogenase [Sporomusa acidovorans DSM 3132]SDF60021.1 FMN-dependent dehydrogenase, includes L-lactate dehydrogenase and type II isopentenyl diphosphate isomerase [Sporomusa acidovorans]
MDINSIKTAARKKFAGVCRVCPICNGVACAGEVPGMGGLGSGSAFYHNIQALADCRLNLRTVHSVKKTDLTCRVLGLDLAMPVIGAAIGGIALNMNGAVTEEEYAKAIVNGCRKAGSIGMTGDGPQPVVFDSGMAAIAKEQGWGIPVIKPRDPEKIVELAKQAAAAGCPAFGMDIDAAALVNMTNAGQPVGPKTIEELEFIKNHTTIPFIVKGIMTPDDAEACWQAGVDAIVVSNHGGRALDHTPGTAEVLPYIVEAVKGKMTVLVDGGIRSGADVLKMLALGADAVLLGRTLAIAAVGGGAEGVELVLNQYKAELSAAMLLTGTDQVSDVPVEILW